MEVKFCKKIDVEMENNIKNIIEDSFNEDKKDSSESTVNYIYKELKNIYPENIWDVLSIHLKNDIGEGYSYHGKGSIFFCYYKKRGIIICSYENNEKIFEDDIKSLSNEKSNLKEKLSNSQIKIKKYESIIEEQKSKLEKIIIENELLQKNIKEKEEEINNIKNEMQQKQENNAFNKTFYTRDQMIALNFISTDSTLHYAIPCLNKDLFVDVEKKLYDKYPEYKEKNNNFLSQGKIVLRFKTVGENRLESGIPIVMQA